jgi:hypothetical protein
MKEHLSIDEKLHTLRQVARDYVTHNFMKQDRVIELIGELEDDIKREVADAASDTAPIAPTADALPYQARVQPWMMECFGAEISADRIERNHRFFEEATELVQANGMTRSEAHQLVDYVFDRPVGELHQEVGGVMVTLAALCLASSQDMHAAGEMELARINRPDMVIRIRAKQASKPKHSPLPTASVADSATHPSAQLPRAQQRSSPSDFLLCRRDPCSRSRRDGTSRDLRNCTVEL